MKKKYISLTVLAFLLFVANGYSLPPPPPAPPGLPIDGGIGLLLLAALGIGVRKLREKK